MLWVATILVSADFYKSWAFPITTDSAAEWRMQNFSYVTP